MSRFSNYTKDLQRESFDSSIDYIEAKIRKRKRRILIIVLTILLLIIGLVSFLLTYFHVEKVYVEGSTRYPQEEIAAAVMDGFLGDNTLAIRTRYRFSPMPEFPFVEKMSLKIESHDTLRITVYEKAVAGYVEYLGSYVYFDRNGIVVETAAIPLSGIPLVTGLKFDHIILYQPLPIDDPAVFSRVLNAAQLLGKYEMEADKIYFDPQNNMSIFFGGVRVDLGQDEYMDEKISNLRKIIPELEGKKGVLSMSGFNSETSMVIFQSSQ